MTNCKQATVDLPGVVKDEDLGVRTGKWAAAAIEGNDHIGAGNACIDAAVIMSGVRQ